MDLMVVLPLAEACEWLSEGLWLAICGPLGGGPVDLSACVAWLADLRVWLDVA